MEHIAAFMLLIACSDDLQTCREYPAPAEAYETVEQCETELNPAVRMMPSGQMKPFGKCVEIDPALVYEDVEIVWDVTKANGIEVALEVINPSMDIQSLASAEFATTENNVH
ncbi:hypothetical protein WNZ14_15380 [Hoeflea sp. AS60]|uniref:hypothetical protein n=1 Tax=Hoeflea sp. AS60 TaxID=3135780 RepID=UPI0031752CC9